VRVFAHITAQHWAAVEAVGAAALVLGALRRAVVAGRAHALLDETDLSPLKDVLASFA
jgi:hypothetical protein